MKESDCYEDDLLSSSLRMQSAPFKGRHLVKANVKRVRKPEIIMNTVEAWSKDFSGQLLQNLKHGDLRQSRSEARPLVFGGTYPIDVPVRTYPIDEPILQEGYQERSGKKEFATCFQPESFPIDQPTKNISNWNSDNVKRRVVHGLDFNRSEDLSDTDLTDSEDCYHVKDE